MSDKKDYTSEDYRRLAHAVQSGVAMKMNYDNEASPKHLRVGVNMAMCDSAAVGKLLIEKGIFTEQEYINALCRQLEEEVKKYERELSDLVGADVTLS